MSAIEAIAALQQLAREFLDQEQYAQAIRCLLAACAPSSQALPTTKATHRLLAAKIILDHFNNVNEAKQQLHAAELDLRSTRTHQQLKCEVLDTLAVCHRFLGETSELKEAYTIGLKTAMQGAGGKDAALLGKWRKYFSFRLAEHDLVQGNPEAALKMLQDIEDKIQLSVDEQALIALCKAITSLVASDVDTAATDLATCASIIEGMESDMDAETLRDMQRQLKASYFFTYVTMAIASGKMGLLKQGSNFPVLEELHQTIEQSSQCSVAFTWLPPEALCAASHMLHASLLRSTGKGSEAAVHLGQAEEILDSKLQQFHIDIQEGNEASLSFGNVTAGRPFATLKVLVLEQRTLAALVATELVKAAKYLAQLVEMLTRFPTLLKGHMASTTLLIGHYAHSTSDYEAAMSRFKMVEDSEEQNIRNMAVLGRVIAAMHCKEGSHSNVIDLLDRHGLRTLEGLQDLPLHERAIGQLVLGLLMKQQGDITGARLLLTKALKQAHSVLGSTQLVGQVLNALAPVQQQKHDADGARQMLDSAMTLMKTVGDIPSLLTTLNRLRDLQGETDAGMAARTADYINRKTDELTKRLQAARSLPEHTLILEWVPK